MNILNLINKNDIPHCSLVWDYKQEVKHLKLVLYICCIEENF